MWGLFTIYGNYEPGLLFVDGPKWKNGTPIRGRREYSIKIIVGHIIIKSQIEVVEENIIVLAAYYSNALATCHIVGTKLINETKTFSNSN